MQEPTRESGAISSERFLSQPGRRSLLIPLAAYPVLAPLVFAFVTFLMGEAVMTAQEGFSYPVEGKSFISVMWHSLLLSKNLVIWFFTESAGDGGIGPPMVFFVYVLGLMPSAIFGFLNYYFAGRIVRHRCVFLIMVALSCAFFTVLVFVIGVVHRPPFFDGGVGTFILVAAFLWVPGFFTPLFCSSITFLIQRWRDRKYTGKPADAV